MFQQLLNWEFYSRYAGCLFAAAQTLCCEWRMCAVGAIVWSERQKKGTSQKKWEFYDGHCHSTEQRIKFNIFIFSFECMHKIVVFVVAATAEAQKTPNVIMRGKAVPRKWWERSSRRTYAARADTGHRCQHTNSLRIFAQFRCYCVLFSVWAAVAARIIYATRSVTHFVCVLCSLVGIYSFHSLINYFVSCFFFFSVHFQWDARLFDIECTPFFLALSHSLHPVSRLCWARRKKFGCE